MVQIGGFRNGDALLRLLGTARNGHFAAHYIDRGYGIRVLSPPLGVSRFGHGAQLCAPPGDDLVGQAEMGVVVPHLHTGVDMYLGKAGEDVPADEFTGEGHGLGLRFLSKGEGAQMIAPQDDLAAGHVQLTGQPQYIGVKLFRRHADIAAELIHLIGGGFDEDIGAVFSGLFQSGAQHIFVGAAAGIDAHALARPVGGGNFL